MTMVSFLRVDSVAQIISATIFFPLFAYFAQLVTPTREQHGDDELLEDLQEIRAEQAAIQRIDQSATPSVLPDNAHVLSPVQPAALDLEKNELLQEGVDVDRRVFLKIIASAGTGLFMMSLFTKRTHAAFFGSVPGPGTMSVKDSTGSVIDPAIKTPTDGYKISEIDDTSSPAYYGFVDKTGAWFITKEEASGAYRYTKGDSSFSTNWSNRASLTYGYFDAIF